MENQVILFVVLSAMIGLFVGFAFSRAGERRKTAAAIDSATEQGRASAAIEIATLRERVRGHDEEREQIGSERETLKSALEMSRNEIAQINERASRVPSLDTQVTGLLEQQKADRHEILRLSMSEAEKSQSFLDVTDRLVEVEKGFSDSNQELAATRQQAAGLREESGRLNAEIKAERESLAILRDKLQEEKDQCNKAEALSSKLAGELAESNKRRAVFETEASRVPSLDVQITGLLEQQNADRQEILRLSTTEAEKSQSLQDVTDRLAEAEKGFSDSNQELAATRQQAAGLREESGRLNAEIKAEREALAILRDKLQEEKNQRNTAEALSSKLTSELAESNKRRAVFEAESSRIPALEEKLVEADRTLAGIGKQAADLRETSGRVNAELKAEREVLAAMRSDFLTEKNQREQAEARANKLTTDVAELNSRLDSEHSQAEEKLSLLLEAKEALSNQFKSLANDILEEKAKRFTEQNQTNIGQLLDPLKTKLQEFQGKVEEVYIQEGKDRTALAEQVRQLMDLNQVLSQDAKNLTSALKGSNKTQGNWGELILERVLEASGLRKGHEYDVQESHTREDGTRAQPDVVVHLPEDRHLIVDAKVSLNAYDACASAEDDGERQVAIKRHLDSVRTHMKGLSDKNYQALYGLKSLDFVLMFIPIEPAFMVAITHDRDLYMEALNKNVLLVSPSTLLFVVRTVAHLWRQESQSKNAQEIAKRGAELYDRLSAFVTDLEKVGDRLRQTQESYTDARNKLYVNKGNVIRQAEMLKQLGVKPTKTIPEAIVDMAYADEEAVVDAVAVIEYAPD